MSNIFQVLLALFGAAFLGSVIGWCARRIVALKDERYLMDQHDEQLNELDRMLQDSEQARRQAQADVSRLEKRAGEADMLNETLAATETDLAELRGEAAQYQQRLNEKDDAIRKANEELQTHKLIARNAENEKQLMLDRATSRARANSGLRHNRKSANTQTAAVANANAPLPESVNPETYRLGSLYDDSAELEIDSDIADMTADISALMDEEERQVLAADMGAQSRPDVVVAGNPDPGPGVEAKANAKANLSPRQSTLAKPIAGNEAPAERRGLFSAFNRRKKP